MNRIGRRALTIPAYLAATAVLTVTAPLWLPLAWGAGRILPAARSAWRVLTFLLAYFWCETTGILASAWLGLRHPRGGERFVERNYALQLWWARTLAAAARRLFRLRFEIEGEDALHGDGVIMLPRHTSVGDTLLPVVFYCGRYDRRLRYVLKRELLADPCLDLVGNRVPNYFADRSSADTAREVAGVAALLDDLGPRDGVLIYPEGTRFSPAKRRHLIDRLAQRGAAEAARRARARAHVLPLRPGGVLGLLERNPGRDLVFLAHTGFEDAAHPTRLFDGSWLDTRVRLRFWRVPFAAVPRDEVGRRALLESQWDRMDAEVRDLRDGG